MQIKNPLFFLFRRATKKRQKPRRAADEKMAAARVVLLLLLAATAAAGPLSKPASGQMPACSCHDVDPRTEFWKPFIEGQDLTCLLSRFVFFYVEGG